MWQVDEINLITKYVYVPLEYVHVPLEYVHVALEYVYVSLEYVHDPHEYVHLLTKYDFARTYALYPQFPLFSTERASGGTSSKLKVQSSRETARAKFQPGPRTWPNIPVFGSLGRGTYLEL